MCLCIYHMCTYINVKGIVFQSHSCLLEQKTHCFGTCWVLLLNKFKGLVLLKFLLRYIFWFSGERFSCIFMRRIRMRGKCWMEKENSKVRLNFMPIWGPYFLVFLLISSFTNFIGKHRIWSFSPFANLVDRSITLFLVVSE